MANKSQKIIPKKAAIDIPKVSLTKTNFFHTQFPTVCLAL